MPKIGGLRAEGGGFDKQVIAGIFFWSICPAPVVMRGG